MNPAAFLSHDLSFCKTGSSEAWALWSFLYPSHFVTAPSHAGFVMCFIFSLKVSLIHALFFFPPSGAFILHAGRDAVFGVESELRVEHQGSDCQPSGAKDFPEQRGISSPSCRGMGCESTSCPREAGPQQCWGPTAAFCQDISPCFNGLRALAPKSSTQLVFTASSPIFINVLLFPFHLPLLLFLFLSALRLSLSHAGLAPALPSKTDHPGSQGSATREEAPGLSCSQMGGQGGTEVLRGTRKQSCSQNRTELPPSPGCSAGQVRGTWRAGAARPCSPTLPPLPGIALRRLRLIFHQ